MSLLSRISAGFKGAFVPLRVFFGKSKTVCWMARSRPDAYWTHFAAVIQRSFFGGQHISEFFVNGESEPVDESIIKLLRSGGYSLHGGVFERRPSARGARSNSPPSQLAFVDEIIDGKTQAEWRLL